MKVEISKVKFNEEAIRELEQAALLMLETVAEDVKITAQSLVQVKTGKLRDSIKVTPGDTEYEKYIGSKTVPYAIFQELGTAKMRPHSYLRPALDYVVNEINTVRGRSRGG